VQLALFALLLFCSHTPFNLLSPLFRSDPALVTSRSGRVITASVITNVPFVPTVTRGVTVNSNKSTQPQSKEAKDAATKKRQLMVMRRLGLVPPDPDMFEK
jgi:hypothetical protein